MTHDAWVEGKTFMASLEEAPRAPQRETANGEPHTQWSSEMAAWRDEQAFALHDIAPWRRALNEAVMGTVNRIDLWFREHWLATVNAGLGVFVGLAVAAPIMRMVGLVEPSQAILVSYHFFCAQTPSHSFFIGGHQVCLCARCLAIFSSVLLGGLLLALLRGRNLRLPPISWHWWLLAMVPMALDGGTQLFGWRESDVFLRLLTGIIFGLGTAWFALPQIEEVASYTPAVVAAVPGSTGARPQA